MDGFKIVYVGPHWDYYLLYGKDDLGFSAELPIDFPRVLRDMESPQDIEWDTSGAPESEIKEHELAVMHAYMGV